MCGCIVSECRVYSVGFYISAQIKMNMYYIGVLKSSSDELMVTFHTSTDEEPKLYTIITTGNMDTVISLLGQYYIIHIVINEFHKVV